jgi:hypothetical protein
MMTNVRTKEMYSQSSCCLRSCVPREDHGSRFWQLRRQVFHEDDDALDLQITTPAPTLAVFDMDAAEADLGDVLVDQLFHPKFGWQERVCFRHLHRWMMMMMMMRGVRTILAFLLRFCECRVALVCHGTESPRRATLFCLQDGRHLRFCQYCAPSAA